MNNGSTGSTVPRTVFGPSGVPPVLTLAAQLTTLLVSWEGSISSSDMPCPLASGAHGAAIP